MAFHTAHFIIQNLVGIKILWQQYDCGCQDSVIEKVYQFDLGSQVEDEKPRATRFGDLEKTQNWLEVEISEWQDNIMSIP